MSSSLSSDLSNLPYISLLSAYPHPAFILVTQKRVGQATPSLNPVFGNSAFRSLLLGPDADIAELDHAFLKALLTVEQAQKFGVWVERAQLGPEAREESLLVELRPAWTSRTAPPVVLELTQTLLDEFLVCTSVPRSPLPRFVPSTHPSTSSGRINRDFNMKLVDLPRHPSPSIPLGGITPTLLSTMRPQVLGNARFYSPERAVITASVYSGGMREMLEKFDWHLTPLGPRSSWSSTLRTTMNTCLSNPFAQSIWWGTELTLIYNDAYAEMAGSKHPSIYGQSGSVSWGELWDTLGPWVNKVWGGEAVARREDLLFFNRLTDAHLPEECYHNWSWLPVEQEDGAVAGFLNSTFDVTQKVITERRLTVLRDLGNNAALARSPAEFANAITSVLNSFTLDAPFAAFYFASSNEEPQSDNGPRTSYIRQSTNDPPIKVEMKLAATVGIPTPHPSTPDTCELLLDPVTLRSSPKARPTTGSPIPSSTSIASNEASIGSSPEPASSAVSQDDRQYLRTDSNSTTSVDASASSSVSGTTSATVVPILQDAPIVWPFADAFSSRQAVHVPHISDYIVEGFELRGWGEHAREAVVMPITADDAFLPGAVLILGLNSRRPYDNDYMSWIDLVRLSLNTLFTAMRGREADATRAERLAELDHAKTSFFSNASHELRTPLTLIAGPLQDALLQVGDTKVKESLRMASRNVTRLTRLVDALMDFNKIAANKLEGRFKAVQLGTLTAELASLFRSVIEKGNIQYIVNCDNNERRLFYIDPDFWEKIVFNVIGNAFKYTLEGSINVSLEFDSSHAHFRVQDTGVGIPEQDIGKIFDRFHRVDSICRSYEGTGIGLALTKELVKLHGGTISVRSAPVATSPDEHGSCFTVSIPIGKDHLIPSHVDQGLECVPQSRTYARGIVDEATHWSSRTAGEERTPSDSSDSGGSSEGGRIDTSTLFFVKSDVVLLVDDSADMRRYIKSLFLPYCKVIEAASGEEALNVLSSVKPSLILSDVMMPGMDGYGLISRVRERPDTKLIPIILVTAREGEESRVEGLLSGADDYLGKPFNGRELIARVHLQMQLGKRRAELEARFLERTREIHLLSDLSPVGIFRADNDGHMLYVNTRWWEISGRDRNAPIDDWPESVTESDVDGVFQAWRSAVDMHKSASLEFRFKSGTYAKGQFEPLITEAGICTGVIGTITDVSDQRLYEASRLAHAQEREATARKRAEEADERRQEADERRRGQELLIDVTSHELRQPVSAILNCSSLVRSNLALMREDLCKCYSEQGQFYPTRSLIQVIDDDLDALDAIYQCGLAQERIANDVLSLSRIQLQVLSIQPVDFELTAEVKRIVSIFRNEVKMKKINLDLRFGHSFESLRVSRVRADVSRFCQVITNLLSNGIKFTDTSPNKKDMAITAEVSRHEPEAGGPCVPPSIGNEAPLDPHVATPIFVYVAVKDSGPGLNPDDLALLFKRFQQGSNSHNVFGGSGLGLFVSRKLCDLMGGRIDVDSVYGEGATFRFFIQVTTVPDTGPGVENGDSAESTSSFHDAMSPLHILITEDNLINQTVLNRQLKKAGHTTSLASNGLQAIEKLRGITKSGPTSDFEHRSFDAILMDCEMPVMDGLTAVREIRKMEMSGELPTRNRIYALTGNARAGQVQSARDAGMDDVIIKPYKLDELLALLQNVSVSD